MTSLQKKLVIIGASGFALEVYWMASRLGYQVVAFLDDNVSMHGKVIFGVKVFGSIDKWTEFSECQFIIAVGSPRVRQKIYNKMQDGDRRPTFATLIDERAMIGIEVVIGEGSIICAGVIATADIKIGRQVIINLNSTIGHESRLGDFVTIAPIVAVSGRVTLGDLAEVGTQAAVRQGLTLGVGAMLGMGGILTKDIPAGEIFVGNPAKYLKSF